MKSFKRSLLLAIMMIVIGTGCSNIQDQTNLDREASAKNSSSQRMEVDLHSIIDGDTIKVSIDGREESVRFLLVDTPETNHPQLGKQPFGEEAKEYTKKLLAGSKVILEKDVSERDKYGRLLMYVYTPDGRSVQEELLKKGLARVAYVFAPNIKYVDQYRELERQAAKAGLGIWSVDGYAHMGHEHGYHTEVFEKTDGATPSTLPPADSTSFAPDAKGNCQGAIKGNQGSNGWLYHVPGGAYYDGTKAEQCFSTEQAAQEAGYKKAKR